MQDGVIKNGGVKEHDPKLTPFMDRVHYFRANFGDLLSNIAQTVARDSLSIPIVVEEANHALRLLEGLNQPIEKNLVKRAVAEFYAILMVLVEGVHYAWSCVARYRQLRADERLCDNSIAKLPLLRIKFRTKWPLVFEALGF
jgi:hypothetical protein